MGGEWEESVEMGKRMADLSPQRAVTQQGREGVGRVGFLGGQGELAPANCSNAMARDTGPRHTQPQL